MGPSVNGLSIMVTCPKAVVDLGETGFTTRTDVGLGPLTMSCQNNRKWLSFCLDKFSPSPASCSASSMFTVLVKAWVGEGKKVTRIRERIRRERGSRNWE